MQFLRSLLFTGFFLLFTFLYAIFFVVASLFLPLSASLRAARASGRTCCSEACKVICGLGYSVEGARTCRQGTHVALVKHSSAWETFAQAVILPAQAWVLKRELTWIPFVGWGLRQLRCIAIDRGAGGRAVQQMIDQGRKRLDGGQWIVVFPEGTRMPPGETRRYGVGGAAIARGDRPAGRAGGAQRRLLLAAARPAEEARHDPRGDRPADRDGRPRSARASTRRRSASSKRTPASAGAT